MDVATIGLAWLPHQGVLLYLAVFAIAMIDAMGLPFPGRVLLIAAGAVLAHDWGQAAGLVAAGVLGALAGDHVWYAVGRVGGDALMGAYCKLSLVSGRCEQRARSTFDRFGPWAIIIGRFFAGIRIASAPMIGALQYPRYLVFAVTGAVVWSAMFVLLGFGLGAQWRTLMDRYGIGTALTAVGGLAMVGFAAVLGVRLLRRRRHGRPEAERRRPGRRRRRAAARAA